MCPALHHNLPNRLTLLDRQPCKRYHKVVPFVDHITRSRKVGYVSVRHLITRDDAVATKAIDYGIAKYAHHPRHRMPACLVKLTRMSPDADESFLHGIFSGIARRKHRYGAPEQA